MSNTSLLDRIRCGISIDDPLFEPFPSEEQDNFAPGAGSGQGQQEEAKAQNSNGPWGSGIASNAAATPNTGNQNRGTIIIIKSPIGEVAVVGPFQDEDEAFDYAKNNRISDDFWLRVTELETP